MRALVLFDFQFQGHKWSKRQDSTGKRERSCKHAWLWGRWCALYLIIRIILLITQNYRLYFWLYCLYVTGLHCYNQYNQYIPKNYNQYNHSAISIIKRIIKRIIRIIKVEKYNQRYNQKYNQKYNLYNQYFMKSIIRIQGKLYWLYLPSIISIIKVKSKPDLPIKLNRRNNRRGFQLNRISTIIGEGSH